MSSSSAEPVQYAATVYTKLQILPNIYYRIGHGKPPPGSCQSLRLSQHCSAGAAMGYWGHSLAPQQVGWGTRSCKGLALLGVGRVGRGGLRNMVGLKGPRALPAHTAGCLQLYLGPHLTAAGTWVLLIPKAPTALCSPLLPEASFLMQGYSGGCCRRLLHEAALGKFVAFLQCGCRGAWQGTLHSSGGVAGMAQLRVGWNGPTAGVPSKPSSVLSIDRPYLIYMECFVAAKRNFRQA